MDAFSSEKEDLVRTLIVVASEKAMFHLAGFVLNPQVNIAA